MIATWVGRKPLVRAQRRCSTIAFKPAHLAFGHLVLEESLQQLPS